MMSMALLFSKSLSPRTLSGVMESTVSTGTAVCAFSIQWKDSLSLLVPFLNWMKHTIGRAQTTDHRWPCVFAHLHVYSGMSVRQVGVAVMKRCMTAVRTGCLCSIRPIPPSRVSLERHSTGKNSTCSSVCSAKCLSSIFRTASRSLNRHTHAHTHTCSVIVIWYDSTSYWFVCFFLYIGKRWYKIIAYYRFIQLYRICKMLVFYRK